MKFVSGVCLNNDFGLLNCTEAKFFIQAVTAKNLMQNLQNVRKSQRCLELLELLLSSPEKTHVGV